MYIRSQTNLNIMNTKQLVLVALCMLVSCAKEVTVSNSESSVQELNAMSSEKSFAKYIIIV